MARFKTWGRGALAAALLLGTAAFAEDDIGDTARETGKKAQREAEEAGRKVGMGTQKKQDYLNRLALFDAEQIAWGEMAQQRGSNPQVRELGGQIARSHRQHLNSLQDYAETQDAEVAMVDLSTMPEQGVGGAGTAGTEAAEREREKMAKEYGDEYAREVKSFKKEREKLSKESGAKFDEKIVAQLDKGQKDGRELVNRGLKNYSDDASLAVMLRNTAPTLEQNRMQIDETRRAVKKEG